MYSELLAARWTFYDTCAADEPEDRSLIEHCRVYFDLCHITRRPVEVIWEKGRCSLFWLYLRFVKHLLHVLWPLLCEVQNGEWHYPNISHISFTPTQKGSISAHCYRGFGLWSLACCFRPMVMWQWERLNLQFSSRNAQGTKIPPIRHCQLVTKPPVHRPVGQRRLLDKERLVAKAMTVVSGAHLVCGSWMPLAMVSYMARLSVASSHSFFFLSV